MRGGVAVTDDREGVVDPRVGNADSEQPSSNRRELIRKLAKAAALPMIVGAFVASDVTDTAAQP